MEKTFLSRNILKILIAMLVVAIICAFFVIYIYASNFHGTLSNNRDAWGQFGDYVGGLLNPLFGFFAFLALIITIVIQNRELSISSQELAKSASALEKQNISLSHQNFERTFFQLVQFHNEIVNSLDLQLSNGNIKKGRDCFGTFFNDFKGIYLNEKRRTNAETDLGLIESQYLEFYKSREPDVGHYFRNLYQIIKFVNDSGVENKRFYTNIVRAQLSSNELGLLFYNCLSPYGKEKFKPLVEKYSLLQNINHEILAEPIHMRFFNKGAFE